LHGIVDCEAVASGKRLRRIINLHRYLRSRVYCVGRQTSAAVVYTATFGVAGNYDGGTKGKQIGEVARRSCTGDWIITPEQVSKDYQ
jgi:hypothetical protein